MLRAAGRDGAADPDAAAEEEPPDDASSTPLAAAPAALPLQTAAALEVAASDHTGIFGLIDAFEQVADVVRETVVAESAQQSEQYSRVLGGVRRQDAPDAAEHQAAAGQARQAQPDAAAHQAAASRKAAEKRSATAMSEEERRAKDAARKREVRAAAAAKEERRRRRREAKAAEAVEAAAAEAAEEAAAEAAAEEEEAKQEREAAMFEAVNAAVVAAGEAEIDSFEFEEFLFHLDRVRYLVDDHELIDEFRMWRQEDTANNQTRRACEEAEAAEEWTADGDEAPQQMNSMPCSWLVEAVRQGVVDEPGWQKWWRPPAHLTAHGYEYEYDAFIPEENEACEPTHGECCGGGGGGGDDDGNSGETVQEPVPEPEPEPDLGPEPVPAPPPESAPVFDSEPVPEPEPEPEPEQAPTPEVRAAEAEAKVAAAAKAKAEAKAARDFSKMWREKAQAEGWRQEDTARHVPFSSPDDKNEELISEVNEYLPGTYYYGNPYRFAFHPNPELVRPRAKPKRLCVEPPPPPPPPPPQPRVESPQPLQHGPPPPTRDERERAAGPPPRREQYVGAMGDKRFQNDRAAWYEAFTGTSLGGDTLSLQNEEFDVVARRFRNYNDGRATIRQRLTDEPSD